MNDSYSILIIEDEKNILDFMSRTLKANGYKTTTVTSGKAGLSIINSQCPDLILLDLGLPDMDGNDIIASVREWTSCPIIVISARTGEHDKVAALDLGADDYMTKPFSVSELLARVKALCRRVGRTAGGDEKEKENPLGMLTSGEFVLDENRRVLLKAGQPIELTQVEFQIMELFFHNPGIALVREKILKGVWGENYFGDVKIVDVNIRRLRMKVEDEPSHPTHIMTVWGYGYRWEE